MDPADESSPDAAFQRYVVPEIPALLRVAQSLTSNAHDAEDLVQDTMLRAYRAIDRFDGEHARAWLFTILRNTHVNRNRKRRPGLLDDPNDAFGSGGDRGAIGVSRCGRCLDSDLAREESRRRGVGRP
jgi:RNA polymerase sigma-70 factor (ECF subfamily)